ncbi:MAG: aminotransferase class V-fold PLP-dependent enzyme [Chloroflexi bacterium]|nr:aminotransferase class V-fold PLP-dependent enzyme [Chloroflexota bacterium]MBM3172889.1 aminotransferase class V-fold PLP-dependent enzyme [Chloroflexota bacterium]MBM3175078.1 aminotransferase class V-fold PLP-dependent enzyme [Chloroflexota bacterium]MBM4449712.1 aminotransferase class V-fold PLP-dependent enzyme [Chloroflexota bacterium]
MIYLDYAATSWPKPPEVLAAMSDVLERAGGNPGRSGHSLSIEAARVVYDAREEVAGLFNVPDPLRVVFTANATHAINMVLLGLLRPGDEVVVSSIEHNAVMRPLRVLEQKGVQVTVVQCASDGTLNPADVARAVSSKTRLVAMVHGSNVMGTLLPVDEVAAIAHKVGALLLVDAAQTAGTLPVDMQAMGMDLLAFTGHKSLQGPTGIGGLIVGSNVDISQIEPVMRGGTGSQSELEEQPDGLPDKYESGTHNTVGIAGLLAGIRWLKSKDIEQIRAHEMSLTAALLEGLSDIPGLIVYGSKEHERSVAVVSFTIPGKHVSEIGLRLDDEFGILCRVGLHCAPAAHRTIGTYPEGTVRLAPGVMTSLDDIHTVVSAVRHIARS